MKKIILGLCAFLFACESESNISKVPRKMRVDPILVDLSSVYLGETVDVYFLLENIQGEEISVTDFYVENLMGETCSYLGDDLVVIPSGEYVEVGLQYQAFEEGFHQCELSFESNAVFVDGAETVVVRAQGVSTVVERWPDVLDFGAAEAGGEESRPVTLSNQSDRDISLTTISSSNSEFSIQTSLPLVIPAESEVSIDIAFNPASDDAQTSDISFEFSELVELESILLRANDCENGEIALYDQDGDGFASCGGDCDDSEATISPIGLEVCDGLDNNCDGTADEGTSCFDDDGDGFTEDDGDCNDQSATVYPEAEEIDGNYIDDDCDGVIDLGVVDLDSDGYSVDGGDCDDLDATVYPNASEVADGLDNDCDGAVDEGTENYDDDLDGYSEADGDCNDANASTYPTATELPDWMDNDCDGTVDEGTENYDDDGDGYSELGGDTDDSDPNIHP